MPGQPATGKYFDHLPWQQDRPAARTKQPLTREAIVAAALKVLDEEGYQALSMRRVAQQLNTGAASLYQHVSNKEQLVDLMLDQVYGEFEVPDADPAHWQEQLKQAMRNGLRLMLAHRGIAWAALSTMPMGPNGLILTERVLAILRAGGLPDVVAGYAGELLGQYISACAIEREMLRDRVPEDDPEALDEFVRQFRGYLQGLPAGQFPNLVAAAVPMTSLNAPEERFELGLDIVVRGLASYAQS